MSETDDLTGAERYLAERLADPEYRAAYEAAAPDDLTTRARRHAETHPEPRELIEELLAEVTRWACIVGEAPPVPSWVVPPCTCKSYNLDGQVKGREEVVLDRPTWMPDGERVNGVPVDECIARVVRFLWDNDVRTWGSCCGHNGRYGPPSLLLDRREDIAWVRTLIAEVDPRIWHLDWVPNRPPVPPWPGAVPSGLVDEDGVPTWLAQAGQVPGEQVRQWRGDEWLIRGYLSPWNWVEVRAPRAVPVPETERVPWWEALGRLGLAGDPFVEVGSGDEGPWVRVVEGGTKLYSPVAPDGTVEVLKDGES